jgi:sugar phosphate isomerase/epimerase
MKMLGEMKAAKLCAGGMMIAMGVALAAPEDGNPAAEPTGIQIPKNFQPGNLVAWCIVPFDAKKRAPAERAAMLKELGIGRLAYDWRALPKPDFEGEILELKKQGIQYFAFWAENEEAFGLFKKYDLHPQIWNIAPSPEGKTQEERVEKAAKASERLAARAEEMGCAFGLYNHGGWGGEPENLIAVCKHLREMGHGKVGIVYNWHHAHGHIADWEAQLKRLQPYLLCLNVNGMNAGENPKIQSLSQGEHELAMLKTLLASGYKGPIGILDHREEMDAHESLRQNLVGLDWLLKEALKEGSGGVKPDFGIEKDAR